MTLLSHFFISQWFLTKIVQLLRIYTIIFLSVAWNMYICGSQPLKLVSAISYQIFLCHQMALEKLWKMFLFHLKSSFCSRDIQIFVFSSSCLFLTFIHCFRGWSKKNLKDYDVINCLSKNVITHFVWYLDCMQEILLKTRYFEKGLSKSLKES